MINPIQLINNVVSKYKQDEQVARQKYLEYINSTPKQKPILALPGRLGKIQQVASDSMTSDSPEQIGLDAAGFVGPMGLAATPIKKLAVPLILLAISF